MKNPSAAQVQDPDAPQASSKELRCSDVAWSNFSDCRHCALRQQALFSALRGTDFDHILVPIKSAIVPTGTVLYLEDDAANAVYTIRWGLIKLVKHSSEGTTRIVRLLGPGAAVGLESVKEGIYWHTAVTMQETGLCRIPFEVVDRLQNENSQVVDRVILQWERYLEYADRWITELSTGPIKMRVHHLICLLVEITDSASGEIEMPSVEDLAAMLGASVESVSRAMAEIKRSKVITRIAPRTYRCDRKVLSC